MTNETIQTTSTTPPLPPTFFFGAKLRTVRESKGIERKDVAAQLRLSEHLIDMLERDVYPDDLPVTFVRGYIRMYGKFLDMPEHDIKQGILPIQPKVAPLETPPAMKQVDSLTSGNYFMQFFTYLIMLTMLGLVGTWWYTHTKTPSTTSSEDTNIALPQALAPRLPVATPEQTITPETPVAATNTPVAPALTLPPAPTKAPLAAVKPTQQVAAAPIKKPLLTNKPAYARELDETDEPDNDNND